MPATGYPEDLSHLGLPDGYSSRKADREEATQVDEEEFPAPYAETVLTRPSSQWAARIMIGCTQCDTSE